MRTALVFLISVLATPAAAQPLDLDLYDRLLASHTRAVDEVVGTRVDYAGLRENADWRSLLEGVSRVDPEALPSREARLAFWINAYNILAIEMVRRHYPVDSIRDIGSFLRPVWNLEAGRVNGKAVTLGQIEHEILRPMGEPRIHAAIVCASTSCPSLRREAFRAERLDEQLDDGVRVWLADPQKGSRLDGNDLLLSKIFDWFEEDFESAGGVVAWARPYLAEATRARLAPNPSVDHFDYDWTLNSHPAP